MLGWSLSVKQWQDSFQSWLHKRFKYSKFTCELGSFKSPIWTPFKMLFLLYERQSSFTGKHSVVSHSCLVVVWNSEMSKILRSPLQLIRHQEEFSHYVFHWANFAAYRVLICCFQIIWSSSLVLSISLINSKFFNNFLLETEKSSDHMFHYGICKSQMIKIVLASYSSTIPSDFSSLLLIL